MSEYCEPWTKLGFECDCGSCVSHGLTDMKASDGRQVDFKSDVIRDRVIACVNACAGVPTNMLHAIAAMAKAIAGMAQDCRDIEAILDQPQHYTLKTAVDESSPPSTIEE